MSIAFVSTMANVPWGGSEVLWYSACCHLASQGTKVHVAYPRWPRSSQPIQHLKDAFGIQVYEHSSEKKLAHRVVIKIMEQVGFSAFMNADRNWLRRIKPSILCVSSGNATEGAPWMRLAVEESIPFLTIAQAHAEFLWPNDREADGLLNLYGAALGCLFVSHGNLQLFENQLGARLNNAEVVANHAAGLWDVSSPWPEVTDGTIRLACVGRLHPSSKGQDLLIDVLRQPQWKDRPLIVSLYGEGPQKEILRRLVDRHQLQKKIQFCGHVSDIAQVWQDNHGLILPSRYEGLPLALTEAMMYGRVAIVTDVAGNAEVLEHGVTGYIAESPTVSALSRTLEEAWMARDHWREMGQLAGVRIRQQRPCDPGALLANKLLKLAKGQSY